MHARLLSAALWFAAPIAAHAAEPPAAVSAPQVSPAAIAPDAPAPRATPLSSAPAGTAVPSDGAPVAPASKEPPKPVKAELLDGTKIEFAPDGAVWVINTDGSRVPAPDGILTLKDGVTFTVKNSARVNEE